MKIENDRVCMVVDDVAKCDYKRQPFIRFAKKFHAANGLNDSLRFIQLK
ncbi:MAG TPA: hypothetical protein VHG71_05755 [Verrucomicrobiae bacterium]|nr:hypothetical protein [Verrucomicrobiae bacterium]